MSRQSLSTAFAVAAFTFAAACAPASIVWNWSADGGNQTGTFTTTGTATAPLAAGSYTITDAVVTQSTVVPTGSVSGGTYAFNNDPGLTEPPYTIVWNGTSVTDIDAQHGDGDLDGLYLVIPGGKNSQLLFGTDNSGDKGPAEYSLETASTSAAGYDLSTIPVLPEPATLSLLILSSMGMLARRRRCDVIV